MYKTGDKFLVLRNYYGSIHPNCIFKEGEEIYIHYVARSRIYPTIYLMQSDLKSAAFDQNMLIKLIELKQFKFLSSPLHKGHPITSIFK